MRNTTRRFIGALALTCLLWVPAVSHASPQLQLGIEGGTYEPLTETIIIDADILTVIALTHGVSGANPDFSFDETYYLSVAIIPSIQPEDNSLVLGSFDISTLDGVPTDRSFDVVQELNYGTPPLDVVLNSLDLPSHGIFETYYAEIPFKFVESDSVTDINTMDSPSTPLDELGDDLFFVKFEVDKSLLSDDYELHFDLYDTSIKEFKKGDELYVDGFAPFSHDAETGGPPPPPVIPEPASMMVWTLLIVGVGAAYLRRTR